MGLRVAARREIIVRCTLILIRVPLIAPTRRLVIIGPGLVLSRCLGLFLTGHLVVLTRAGIAGVRSEVA